VRWILPLAAIVLLLAASGEPAAAPATRTFWVSPSGSDESPGTEAQPFKTLEKARTAVRAVNANMTGDLLVILRGGTHALVQTLVFEPKDSGTNGHHVIYKSPPGETPILSGGKRIIGWTPDTGSRWKAPTDIDNFRQLYVNGVRALRARGSAPPGITLHRENGYKLAQPDMASWRNQGDIEFCYIVTWAHSRCKVKEIARQGADTVVSMLQPHFTMARTKEGVQVKLPTYIENAFELLDQPGEWYLDRAARTIYYIPKPGEDMKAAEVIAPAIERLVELRGTLDQPVHHIQFVGLTFAHAAWLRPSEIGHPDVQANFINDPDRLLQRSGTVTTLHNEQIKSPANVVCRAVKSVLFEGCTFTQLGGAGLDIEFGSQENVVSGCQFHDVAGSAIQVGGVLKDDHHPDDPRKIVKNNAVTNCYIHAIGQDFKGSVGIFVGYTDGTVIRHNEISHLPYTGVSVGWGWGEEDAGGGAYGQKPFYDTPTAAKNNRVEFNHIHHVMQELQDGGGIYTLSIQPGTVLRGNHIHDDRGGPGGIYLDEGSGQIEVTGNLVYNVPRAMNYNNAAQNRRATCNEHDNFFDLKPGQPGFPQKIADEAGPEPAWRRGGPMWPPSWGAHTGAPLRGNPGPPIVSVSDYDGGDVYWVRDGQKQPYHGMREAWVFNRAMAWLDDKAGVEGAVLCYSAQSPLLLTGKKQVSRWFTSKANELADMDDETTRFVRRDPKTAIDHALLPAFQFHIEQNPVAELEVTEATHPWQFLVVVKGRSGPPLFASPWQEKPGKLTVELLRLFRGKGYERHFAQLSFALAVHAKEPKEQATAVFRLRLKGQAAVIASLPVVRTAERAKAEGVPIYTLVLGDQGERLGKGAVEVSTWIAEKQIHFADTGNGVWKAVLRDLPAGHRTVHVGASWPRARRVPIGTTLDVHITHAEFIGYDPNLKLLTEGGKPIGPVTGSYRGHVMFKGIGTPQESLVQGQADWDAVKGAVHAGQHGGHGGPLYGFHWWESLTERELDADYAYLARSGWLVVHLCQGWWLWERLDAGGRIAPHGSEQLAAVCAAARRHGLRIHFALSHYPLGQQSAPYAQYLEAGYTKGDYGNPQSKFYGMFKSYLGHFTTLFRDETAFLGFTAAGEGDPSCGPAFVNAVHDFVHSRDPNHLLLAEPHHGMRQDPNFYAKTGWKPLLGGWRTYFVDRQPLDAVGAQFKLSGLGHLFMAEGLFWGYMGGPTQTQQYRERLRETYYTGLANRCPIMMTWEERVVEDEHAVLKQVCDAVDWSKPFQRPKLAIRVDAKALPDAGGKALSQYERALSKLPLDYACVWENDPIPPETIHTIDARQPFVEPAFVSEGGQLPETLKAEMPLRLPAGFAASYSWSQDRTALLAFIRDADSGPAAARTTTEAGDYTYVDTTLVLERDTAIDTWEVDCVRPGAIRLLIYRREGDELVRVGQSEMVQMTRAGLNRFSLPAPIPARRGDLIGFYIPGGDTHIAADSGGSMFNVEGPVAEARTPVARWQTEPKRVFIRVFCAAEEGRLKAGLRTKRPPEGGPNEEGKPARPVAGLVLQNFPDRKLFYSLFDLAEKKVASRGSFAKGVTLALGSQGRHWFLLVNDHE